MDLREELKSADTYPTGPVSAWPRERDMLLRGQGPAADAARARAGIKMPGVGKMAQGLLKTAGQAIKHGKVSQEIRDERYETCKACPLFDKNSKRCTGCGCFMEAKTWVGGDPAKLCPKAKWSR